MAKKLVRLTESDLHRIIKESVNKALNERTKGEQGLTDDEVSRKRTLNFADDFYPEYGDTVYDDEQEEYMNKMHARRKQHHNATQNHKAITQESQLHNIIKKSVKSVLREAFGDGRIEASLQRMIDTFMSPNYDGESDTCDYFYYIWEHAGNYGKVEVDGTNVCFYNQELGGLAVEVGEREIYINPEFEYSFDEKWFKQITSYCKAFQKAIINCVENA